MNRTPNIVYWDDPLGVTRKVVIVKDLGYGEDHVKRYLVKREFGEDIGYGNEWVVKADDLIAKGE